MKIKSCLLENFGSYKSLEFDFQGQGLTLIQGPTGSGKSTLCDAIPWCLFGRTAKDGAVDEVLSWPGDKVCKGTVTTDAMTVTRVRGKGRNDLYFSTSVQEEVRGKDLQDTQRLINSALGMDINLYLSGAYFHEFSQTAQFFTTTPKNRRLICEQIADLSLAKTLTDKASDAHKEANKELIVLVEEISTLQENTVMLERIQKTESSRQQKWAEDKKNVIKFLKLKVERYEQDKSSKLNKFVALYEDDLKKLQTSTLCSECGATKEPNKNAESHYKQHIENILEEQNPYLETLEKKEAEVNPHTEWQKSYKTEIKDKKYLTALLKRQQEVLDTKIHDLSMVKDLVAEFRSVVVRNVISRVEAATNSLLREHFDAEISVTMETSTRDSLDTMIYKNGNLCAYTQLSKGQRQILKLCFGISIIQEVSNHHGIKFSSLFFDEALSGLDDTMKIKAFRMLENVSIGYDSVFVIDHNEAFKSMFLNGYDVTSNNGISKVARI